MKRLTVTMRRTVTIAALGLLFFVAGCIVQTRPDGGMRIDLPPFGPPTSPVASQLVTATMPFTVTAVVVDRSVLTDTNIPTGTIPTTVTATLIATAPTTVPTNTMPTAVPTTTATMTMTATVTGTPPMTPTGTVTTTGTPTPAPGTPVTGTPPTGTTTRTPTTLTPPPGTRTAVPTNATTSPTATSTKAATPTPTRTATRAATSTSTATATVPITPTSATPPATPTPIPGTVFLGSHHGYVVDSTFYVVGEVLNGESFPVFNVKVIGSFYDANGNLVGAQQSLTNLIQIEPELDSPFKLAIPSSGNISRYELTLVWDDVSIVDYEELTVLSQEIRGEGQREIFGELRNDGSVDVRDIVVVVTFYDESGMVVDTYQGSTSEPTVAPNGTVGYTIPITNPDLKYARFTVQAQGSLMLF